jgi:hypothetical protein
MPSRIVAIVVSPSEKAAHCLGRRYNQMVTKQTWFTNPVKGCGLRFFILIRREDTTQSYQQYDRPSALIRPISQIPD